MTNQGLKTLAYTKRRTTFQDELQAAVTARAKKTTTDHFSYSDDFDQDVDDYLNKLIKSRKTKTEAFKAGKSKAKLNTFDLSEDEDKPVKTKRVSFLKSQRIEDEPPDPSSVFEPNGHNSSNSSPHSAGVSGSDTPSKQNDVEPVHPQLRETFSKSVSPQTSDDTFLDLPLPLSPESHETQTPGPEERSDTVVDRRSQSPTLSGPELGHAPSAGVTAEREPPKPKPRQRTLALRSQAAVNTPEESECQDLNRPQTSSTSIPLSSDMSSNAAVRSCSPHWTEDEGTGSHSLSKSSSSKSDESQLLTKSATSGGSESIGDRISDNSKEQEGKSPELREAQTEPSPHSASQRKTSLDTRTSSSQSKISQRPQSARLRKVESKYLGSLKVLDRKVSLQDSQPQDGNTLRAAIYQEWLKKKRLTSKDYMQQKKEEEILREKKKKEEEMKQEEAVASYEAWKEKKAESLKAKAKEKQQLRRKEQRASEEKEEKRQTAHQMFEKWKQEHDQLLRDKHRKQREAEDKRRMRKQGKEEERKRESLSVFSQWCEKKKDVIHEKVMSERKESRTKAEEERYMKEERDKMALVTYENWLTRKDLEQKRQREEKQIKAILRVSPPPPWSPPNKTIVYTG